MAIYKCKEKLTKIRRGDQVVGKVWHGKNLVYQSKALYTITYIWDGHINQEVVVEGESVLNPTSFTPYKVDRTHIGWDIVDNSTSGLDTLVATRDMTLYAVWLGVPYTLKLTDSGWTKYMDQGSFEYLNIGFLVANNLTVYAKGQYSPQGYAIGGYYTNIDTHGCKYVDISTGVYGVNDRVTIDGSTVFAPAAASIQKTFTLPNPTSAIKSLNLRINSSGDTYNQLFCSISSTLYFHN